MTSRLAGVRGPTVKEVERGAEIAFDRIDSRGETRTVLASFGEHGWQQFGESTDILGDNVDAVEAWFSGIRAALELVESDE